MNASSPNAERPPLWTVATGGVLLLACAVAFAFYVAFSRSVSQDEGYLMITVRGFLDGHPLYDSVFTQYGPFYYFYEWILRTVLQIPLTHDATRWLCMFHWLAAAGILGIAARRFTASITAGVFVFAQAVVHLQFVTAEPGHPQEIVALLLALGALAATRKGSGTGAWGLLALIAAALALTKINVGIFFGFALFLAIRCHAADRFARLSNGLLLGLCAVVPFILLRRHVTLSWGLNYSILGACALVAVFIVGSQTAIKSQFTIGKYLRVTACFVTTAVVLIGVAVVTGSSAHGLLDGLLLTPLSMPGAAVVPIHLGDLAPSNAALAVLVAVLCLWKRTHSRTRAIVTVLKQCYGIVGAFLLVGEPGAQFAYLLPWVWLILVPAGNQGSETGAPTFPRVFLCLAAAGQALQAYPVAGTQVTIATFLLALTYTICLADGVKTVCRTKEIRERLARMSAGKMRFAAAFGTVALLCMFTLVWSRLPAVRENYANLPSLDLPGSRLIHATPADQKTFHQLSRYLATESDTFISYPCMNSLYFWSGKQPPTLMNGAGWTQFTHQQQEQILVTLSKAQRPRIVLLREFAAHLALFGQTKSQIEPLIEYISQCDELQQIGPYLILAPKQAAQVAQD